jgi:phosphoribosylformylglycinamidine cyclo-ligase
MTAATPSNPNAPLSYEQAGVNYDLIDPLKVAAQRAAAATGANLASHGFSEVLASRGESAYVVDVGPFYLASIVECLGTKTLVADEMRQLTGKSYYDGIAQDTIAMASQRPDHRGRDAAGGAGLLGRWRLRLVRRRAARRRWWRAGSAPAKCAMWLGRRRDAGAGGHRGRWARRPGRVLHRPHQSENAAVGGRQAGRRATPSCCSPPAASTPTASRLARKLAERLPKGYLTDMPAMATTYGEALLAPTVLYSPVTEALYKAGIFPHYCANVTGHGWRKLLRHPKTLTYRIHRPAREDAGAGFIQQQCGQDDREAYGTLNMGAGFALYVAAGEGQRVVEIAQGLGIAALVAGGVEDGPKQVVIEPVNVVYGADELQLR